VEVGLEELDGGEVRVVLEVVEAVGAHDGDGERLQEVEPLLRGLGGRGLFDHLVELGDVARAGEVVGEARVVGDRLAEAGGLEELVPLLVGVGQEADPAVLGANGLR
jgi:hypothetical protein